MRRNKLLFIGLIFFLSGIILIIQNYFSLTGFATSSFSINFFSLLPFLLIFAGLALMLIQRQDTLQEILEQTEKINPSPSLKNAPLQTEEEGKYFNKRSLKKFLFFGDWEVNKKDEKNENRKSPIFDGSKGKSPPIFYRDLETKKNYETIIKVLRNEISRNKKDVLKMLSKDEEDFSSALSYYNEFKDNLDQLKKELDESGVKSLSNKILEKTKNSKKIRKIALKGYGRLKKGLKDYIISNNLPVSKGGIERYIEKIDSARKFLNIKKGRKLNLSELEKEYLEKTKTTKISKLLDYTRKIKNSMEIVHGIPISDYANRVSINNPSLKRKLKDLNMDHGQISPTLFLDLYLKDKPAISASSVESSSLYKDFFSPVGIILKEGKIYDADSEDFASHTEPFLKNLRLRRVRDKVYEFPIEIRARKAALEPKLYGGNEFIIGGGESQKAKGIYFLESHRIYNIESYKGSSGNSKQKVLKQIANYSVEHNLSLYKFSEGKGFEKVNPNDYLIKKKSKKRTSRKKK